MKTMPILIAMLMAGSAIAGYEPMTVNEIHAMIDRFPFPHPSSVPDMTHINDEACKPTKVDYTIVTLPDGKTASALTFKD
jgi:hypothetical protein